MNIFNGSGGTIFATIKEKSDAKDNCYKEWEIVSLNIWVDLQQDN